MHTLGVVAAVHAASMSSGLHAYSPAPIGGHHAHRWWFRKGWCNAGSRCAEMLQSVWWAVPSCMHVVRLQGLTHGAELAGELVDAVGVGICHLALARGAHAGIINAKCACRQEEEGVCSGRPGRWGRLYGQRQRRRRPGGATGCGPLDAPRSEAWQLLRHSTSSSLRQLVQAAAGPPTFNHAGQRLGGAQHADQRQQQEEAHPAAAAMVKRKKSRVFSGRSGGLRGGGDRRRAARPRIW